jgi:hypothetical protein
MLADATRFIRSRSKRLTLVARRAEAAAPALGVSPDEACRADWRDFMSFSSTLSSRIAAMPPDLALLWVHDSGHRTLLWLLQQLARLPILIVHVLGSSSGDPRGGDADINAILAKAPSMDYVTVVLGSKALPGGDRRWLKNDEICVGAIEAVQSRCDVVVGEIIPLR